MKYKKYLLENKDIPRTTQHRWRRRTHHVGVRGPQNAVVDMLQQDPAFFDMRIKHMSDTLQQNQTSEDQNPVLTISPVQTSSQQEVAKDSTTPHGSSILHNKVEVNVQVRIRCHTNIPFSVMLSGFN
ncbi:uncharacterized protein LOC117594504 isoform X2 [Esox lucius]|uniref:uncharacterized protein LOC117594504 isoform X2 n=1 Tax=Esox lucius TaxID=8010 RepID=UPI00147716D6|nr:uncharacterized protein LOC117594504 isoform X2 [Esox lucius]